MLVFHLRYIAFDFHKECSKMRWHRLQILVDAVSDMQDEFGFVFITVLSFLHIFFKEIFHKKLLEMTQKWNVCEDRMESLMCEYASHLSRTVVSDVITGALWFLNADSAGTLWWAQTGRCRLSSLGPSVVTVWTAWTAPTSFRACWPDAPFRASCRWERITNSIILSRCDTDEDTCALQAVVFMHFSVSESH